MNVFTATTAELVAFYNLHAAKPVNRFADRKTAERRVAALVAAVPAAALVAAPASAYVVGTCPKCGASRDITCGTVVESRGLQHVTKEHEALCHSCGHEFDYNTGVALRNRNTAPNKNRAAAISASWADKRVAQARITRHAVRVVDPAGGSGAYKSVRHAFLVLALPLGVHIKFRGALKATGSAEIGGFKFSIAQ